MLDSRQERRIAWSATGAGMVLGIAAVRTASRPCHGIWHDARLHVVQALHNLHPQRYSNDLLFRYGSRDSSPLRQRRHIRVPMGPQGLAEACSDPALDLVVLSEPAPAIRPFRMAGRTFHLLDCSQLVRR